MRGGDFDDLVLVGSPCLEEIAGDREMLVLAVALGKRLVRDRSHEVLEERVLATVRGPRIALERDDLLADQRVEQFLEVVG